MTNEQKTAEQILHKHFIPIDPFDNLQILQAIQEYSDQQNAELRERIEELKTTIAGYKECFEQFVPEDKWDEATAFLSSHGNGLAKEIQNKGL